MTFDDYWKALEGRVVGGKIDKAVHMTPEQFRRMQKQAYEIGYKAGLNESPRAAEDATVNRLRNMFGMS